MHLLLKKGYIRNLADENHQNNPIAKASAAFWAISLFGIRAVIPLRGQRQNLLLTFPNK
tara:strand:- start:220 stop:396 length:177 start_codon:yes stop_codon:yes gene_type:complete